MGSMPSLSLTFFFVHAGLIYALWMAGEVGMTATILIDRLKSNSDDTVRIERFFGNVAIWIGLWLAYTVACLDKFRPSPRPLLHLIVFPMVLGITGCGLLWATVPSSESLLYDATATTSFLSLLSILTLLRPEQCITLHAHLLIYGSQAWLLVQEFTDVKALPDLPLGQLGERPVSCLLLESLVLLTNHEFCHQSPVFNPWSLCPHGTPCWYRLGVVLALHHMPHHRSAGYAAL
jgi:hypothetical protein